MRGDVHVGVCIPAAGSGRRMGAGKTFLSLRGEPILLHTLRPFLEHPDVVSVAVALSASDFRRPPPWLRELDSRISLVAGGATRAHSVRAALEALGGEVDVVLVHDAARPLVTREIIDRCIHGVRDGIGVVAGWSAVDTMQEVDPEGFVVSTPDRASLWHAQTPQGFVRSELAAAYDKALSEDAGATDDAGVFVRFGGKVRMVEGAAWNLKVTHPEDLDVAEVLLSRTARPDG